MQLRVAVIDLLGCKDVPVYDLIPPHSVLPELTSSDFCRSGSSGIFAFSCRISRSRLSSFSRSFCVSLRHSLSFCSKTVPPPLKSLRALQCGHALLVFGFDLLWFFSCRQISATVVECEYLHVANRSRYSVAVDQVKEIR